MDASDPRARLAALVAQHGVGYAALSRMLRRNDAYLQQYVRRGTPRVLAERDRALLAAYFRVDQSELGGPPTPRMTAIRRLSVEASAGPGAMVDGAESRDGARTMLLDPRLLTDLRLSPSDAGMLTARGDSMLPTIADGDTLVVDERDQRVGARPAIFVLRHDGVLLVKRVSRRDAAITVASDNPAYPDIVLQQADIVGRVVWLSRALR
ncbi:S24 family peptidase [Sphingomonas sp. CARO-RG-8B-R24-01]|uniref:S24 family peptidase n=1 Tax=Sphingomonas sp. CARO-RG-8B-R24-01 TaxID=2914831 RepID=UPI001F5AA6D8|nr:S24 family peptidase [Sphingomonas sp. CARO-RG-8B-R24-01]